MKKIFNILFHTFALLLIAAGCQQREIEQPAAPSNFLKASMERSVATKSQLGQAVDGKYYAFWTSKDELAVYVDGTMHPDKYVLSQGAGSESGVFAGSVTGNRYVALYPYSDRVQGEGLKDNVLSLVLPETQVYSENTFGEGAFPMLAVSEGDELPFKNLCAVLKVSMTGDVYVKALSFVPHDESMAVSGLATVRTDFEGGPELVMSEGGSPRVTLACSSLLLSDDKATDFYIVIPAGTYKGGFSVEVETFSGTFTRSVHSDVTFERSQCRYIAPFRCDADGVIDPDDIPHDQIWYKTSNGSPIFFQEGAFDRKIISNEYKDGKGVILFDGPVTKIGENVPCVFYGTGLKEINLPNSIEVIGEMAFGYTFLKDFHTPDNLSYVGPNVFAACSNLARFHGSLASSDGKSMVLPDGTMAGYAYAALGADLVIPEGVKSINPHLFEGCSVIETVTFPESVVSLGEQVFSACYSIREFKGKNDHIPDGHAFVNSGGELAAFAGNGLVDYVIPEDVKYFYPWTFTGCRTLHSLTFPPLSFSDYYEDNYFYACDNLEFFYGDSVTSDNHGLIIWGSVLLGVTKKLPVDYRMPSGDGLLRVNGRAFSHIEGVERVTLPDEIKDIGGYAFADMPDLRAVRMPAELVYMGYDTFNNDSNLDTLYLRSFAPPSYTEYNSITSDLSHEGLVICVPEGYEDTYKGSSGLSKYADYIRGWHYDDLAAPDYYITSDYSRDGEVTLLQKAKKGNGIDIVLMGDAFSDRQVEDGTYAEVMDKMMEAFFSEEPYTSFRDYFNVYAVTVISATEGYEHSGSALSGWFGQGTEVGGNHDKCFSYALKVLPQERMDDVLVIVAMNSTAYGGTCYMFQLYEGDYGRGASVAYFPIGKTDTGLAELVHHEAGGHGFARLDDEYAYESMGTVTQSFLDNRISLANLGWWKNIDFTSDPKAVKWARFLSDDRYRYDGLGVFEGACTFWRGAWRPTENSIMRYNTGGFNAPSREAIWYKIHKLAYGESWQYDYEDFVAYDAVNRKTAASAATARRYAPERPFTPTAPPVVVPRRWNDPAPAPAPARY